MVKVFGKLASTIDKPLNLSSLKFPGKNTKKQTNKYKIKITKQNNNKRKSQKQKHKNKKVNFSYILHDITIWLLLRCIYKKDLRLLPPWSLLNYVPDVPYVP